MAETLTPYDFELAPAPAAIGNGWRGPVACAYRVSKPLSKMPSPLPVVMAMLSIRTS